MAYSPTMPDARKHRGPDHADEALFAESRVAQLRRAVEELSWLEGRGYAEPSALKLVGDRYQLKRRQREAVRRASCSGEALESRTARRVDPADVKGRVVRVDGFNVVITVEAALSGAAVFRGRDGCFRDIASIHGSYRQVQETTRALTLVGETLSGLGVAGVQILLDSPVSNSGRLRNLASTLASDRGWSWQVDLVRDPDRVLVGPGEPVASSDAGVLDGCGSWINLAALVVRSAIPGAWIVDLG